MNVVPKYAGSSTGGAGEGRSFNGSGGTSVHSLIEHSVDHGEVRRFESPPAYQSFKIKWREKLYCQTGVYVERWYLETPWFSLRLHHWKHSDDSRHFHDHPWNFYTFILKGGYTDCTPNGNERMTAGKLAYREAKHQHTVQVDKGGCWSILLTGPKVRRWGFWVGKKWKKANKYFLEHGKHVCE